jgi:predicted GIY-YIG superfamily endonuclease
MNPTNKICISYVADQPSGELTITEDLSNKQAEIENGQITIYKIYSKNNQSICYIGQTNNYKTRMSQHRGSCKTQHTLQYKIINENGGWNEFNHEVIDIIDWKLKKIMYGNFSYSEKVINLFESQYATVKDIEGFWIYVQNAKMNTQMLGFCRIYISIYAYYLAKNHDHIYGGTIDVILIWLKTHISKNRKYFTKELKCQVDDIYIFLEKYYLDTLDDFYYHDFLEQWGDFFLNNELFK